MKLIFCSLLLALLLGAGCSAENRFKKKASADRKDTQETLSSTKQSLQTEDQIEVVMDGPELDESSLSKSRPANPAQIDTAGGTRINVPQGGRISLSSKTSSSKKENAEDRFFSSEATDTDFSQPKNAALLWLAALLLVAGVVVAVWLGRGLLGFSLGAGGVLLFGLLYYPWVAGVGIVAVSIGGLVWFLYSEKAKQQQAAALGDAETVMTVFVQAVEKTSAEAQAEIKKAIAAISGNAFGQTVKSTVTAIKQRLGL